MSACSEYGPINVFKKKSFKLERYPLLKVPSQLSGCPSTLRPLVVAPLLSINEPQVNLYKDIQYLYTRFVYWPDQITSWGQHIPISKKLKVGQKSNLKWFSSRFMFFLTQKYTQLVHKKLFWVELLLHNNSRPVVVSGQKKWRISILGFIASLLRLSRCCVAKW